MKKILAVTLAAVMLSACSGGFDANKSVSLISREAGSGTRDAFVELTGVLVKENGKKEDKTSTEAITMDGTQAVISSVTGNEYAVGYISLGSLNSSVKALKVEGVEPTAENVESGKYKISRPFNVAYKEGLSAVAADFLDYLASSDASAVVKNAGYVPIEGKAYTKSAISGKVVVAGSSSVSPVMEKLAESYMAINTSATIEIQTTDSSSGVSAAQSGSCDIAMASRALKDSEAATLKSMKIATDGIVLIVNSANTLEDITIENIRALFTGEKTTWADVIK